MNHSEETLRLPLWIAICLMIGAGAAVLAQQPPTGAKPRFIHLDVVCSSALFRDVNSADVIAASKVWMIEFGKRRGMQLEPSIVVTHDFAELRRRVADSQVSVLFSTGVEYLRLAPLKRLQPLASLATKTQASSEYVLVVHQDSGWSRPQQLQGKMVNSYSRTDANLGVMWLDLLLEDNGLPRRDRFFRSLTVHGKPSAACLPVYFHKADACVIDRNDLDLLAELNPQVGSKLKVIATSVPLIESLLSLHDSATSVRSEIAGALDDLHLDSTGKQMLMLFKSGRALRVVDRDLAPLRDLWTRHNRTDSSPLVGQPATEVWGSR